MKDALENMKTDLLLEYVICKKHAMLLYDSMECYRNIAFNYIRDGLETGDKCIMSTDRYTREMIREDFLKHGINVDHYIAQGNLSLWNIQEFYENTTFDPEKKLKKWQELSIESRYEGYNNLRVIGEATFALRNASSVSNSRFPCKRPQAGV